MENQNPGPGSNYKNRNDKPISSYKQQNANLLFFYPKIKKNKKILQPSNQSMKEKLKSTHWPKIHFKIEASLCLEPIVKSAFAVWSNRFFSSNAKNPFIYTTIAKKILKNIFF